MWNKCLRSDFFGPTKTLKNSPHGNFSLQNLLAQKMEKPSLQQSVLKGREKGIRFWKNNLSAFCGSFRCCENAKSAVTSSSTHWKIFSCEGISGSATDTGETHCVHGITYLIFPYITYHFGDLILWIVLQTQPYVHALDTIVPYPMCCTTGKYLRLQKHNGGNSCFETSSNVPNGKAIFFVSWSTKLCDQILRNCNIWKRNLLQTYIHKHGLYAFWSLFGKSSITLFQKHHSRWFFLSKCGSSFFGWASLKKRRIISIAL
jgi:hypothetical protein